MAEKTKDNPLGLDRPEPQPKYATPFLDALARVAKTDDGEMVIAAILAEGRIYNAPHNGNSKDYFLNGRRNLALWLLDALGVADINAYPRILAKQAEDVQRQKAKEGQDDG